MGLATGAFSGPSRGLLLAAALFATVVVRADRCKEVLGDFLGRGIARAGRHYVAGDPTRPLSFGLEVEVSLAENPKIVLDYRPPAYSDEAWLALPQAGRLKLAKEHFKNAGRGQMKSVVFERVAGADARLPKVLTLEREDRVELSGMVFPTLRETQLFLFFFLQRYGAGSFQGHVAYPQGSAEGTAGYVIFETDRAQLKALENGYARHLLASSSIPGANLVHPSLGPLDRNYASTYRELEAASSRGEQVPYPSNARFIYGPSFRGDVYPPGHAGFELRQLHKRAGALLDAMEALAVELEGTEGLSRYRRFTEQDLVYAGTPADAAWSFGISLPDSWPGFFRRVGIAMEKKYVGQWGGTPSHQRFFYPLRNWEEHPAVLSLPASEREVVVAGIRFATVRFFDEVTALVEETGSTPITTATLDRLRILTARWAHDAQLSPIFERYRERTAGPTRPDDSGLPATPREFRPGAPYVEYRMTPNATDSIAYQRFLERSIEVIYVPTSHGHINLRVGNVMYSLGTSTPPKRFSPDFSKGRGYVFLVDRITPDMHERLRKFYDDVEGNLLPFYVAGQQLELQSDGHGGVSFLEPDGNVLFNKSGTIVQEGRQSFFVNRNGKRAPLESRRGKLYIDSVNCATGVQRMLSEVLGIRTVSERGAEAFSEKLAAGKRDDRRDRRPDAVIRYGE